MTTTNGRVAEATPRWCRADAVLWRRTLDGAVVLPVGRGAEPFALHGPAAAIWDLLAQPLTIDELTAKLASMHDIDEARVASEVGATLATLSELGALWLR